MMLNHATLVGRIVRDLELNETETGKKVTTMTLAVPRNYKNTEGEYETDFIDCTLWTGIAESTASHCHKGDLVGVAGRLQTTTEEIAGKKISMMRFVAEKVTFLSTGLKTKSEQPE